MEFSKSSKACLSIVGSLIGLSTMLFVARSFTVGADPLCHTEIRICNKENQLYHLPSKQCLQNGASNGRICSINMAISPLFACRIQGECECDYENNERHLVYDDETDQCYPIYSKGPCEDGYVVTVSSNGRRLNCKRDICFGEKSRASSIEGDRIVPFKNQCHTLSTKLDEPGCNGELKFWKNQLHPSCSPPPTYEHSVSGFASLKCQPGSRGAFLRSCRPSVRLHFRHPSGGDSEEDSD